ncbi:MAG: hypothetical protein AB4372_06415 [Xenococcus sp. (in: cyanobacteria)]
MNFVNFDQKKHILLASSILGSSLVVTQPVFAQSDPVADVESTLSTIGTIAGTAAGIVVVSLGVRLAIKQVNRVMTKG